MWVELLQLVLRRSVFQLVVREDSDFDAPVLTPTIVPAPGCPVSLFQHPLQDVQSLRYNITLRYLSVRGELVNQFRKDLCKMRANLLGGKARL